MAEFNWREFINLEYWLEGLAGDRGAQDPTSLIIYPDSWIFWTYLSIFAGFMIAGILLKASQTFLDSRHPLQNKIPAWSTNLALMGFLGFAWFFFREINVNMLNSRIWLLVGLVWLLVFIGWVLRYFFGFYRLEVLAYKRQKEKESNSDKDSKAKKQKAGV
jgi:hypothetical protein